MTTDHKSEMGDCGVFGFLTILVAVLGLVAVVSAFVFVTRLENRAAASLGEKVGAHKAVLDKVRRRESLSPDERSYAAEMISDCRSLLAYSIPAVPFTVGCFYVFGCLQQLHGAAPTARTFIGLLPMFGGTNLTIQLLRVARLKGRLQNVSAT